MSVATKPTPSPDEVKLPFFGATLAIFHEAFLQHLRKRAHMCGVLAAINRHAIHEGRESIIIRSSQDSERVDMKVASCELEISGKEAASFKVDDVFKAIETLAGQLARDQAKGFFETLNEVTDRTGNVVDGRGKPLTHETFFEMLEKMEHNFPNGPKSTDLVAVVPPSMIERLQRLDAEFQNSPELKK